MPDYSLQAGILACLQQNKKGLLLLTPTGITFAEAQLTQQFSYQINTEDDWYFKEQIGNFQQLIVTLHRQFANN